MHSSPVQAEACTCAYCSALFVPKRAWESFCKPACRRAYDLDFGTQGSVRSVRRLKSGVSVVLHFADGPAAERAINLRPGERAKVVKGKT